MLSAIIVTNAKGPLFRPMPIGSVDIFDTPVSHTPSNVLEIASHYPYNPERWRLFVDGSRVFPEYNSVSQYNHAGPHHELIPNQGETVIMQTAERPRYAVGLEQVFTMAFYISRSLETGDQIRVGPFDDNDGWFLEHNPDHGNEQVNLVVREGGTDTTDVSNASLSSLTSLERYELRTAWYRVTPQLWRQTIEDGNLTSTNEIERTSAPNGGPEVGNVPIRFEVTRGGSASALTLNAGSVSLITQGDKPQIRRVKTHEVQYTTSASAASSGFVPQYAFRLDPDRQIVDTQISNVEIMKYGGTNDVRAILTAHDPSKVNETSDNTQLDDADFSTPPEHHAQNSVIEEIDPSSFTLSAADNGGTLTSAATTPGGYQVGYASRYSAGTGSQTQTNQSDVNAKRGIWSGDIVVVWSDADDNSVNATLNITTEQDY